MGFATHSPFCHDCVAPWLNTLRVRLATICSSCYCTLSAQSAVGAVRDGAMMRALHFGMLVLLVTTVGCGTFHNLKDPPNGPNFVGTGSCYPFGGVVRSGLLGVIRPPSGVATVIGGNIAIAKGDFGPGFKQVGYGTYLTAAGLIAIVDCPLSLAGDIVTFPIAYARSNDYSWATWWGEKSFRNPPPFIPEKGDTTIDGRIETPD